MLAFVIALMVAPLTVAKCWIGAVSVTEVTFQWTTVGTTHIFPQSKFAILPGLREILHGMPRAQDVTEFLVLICYGKMLGSAGMWHQISVHQSAAIGAVVVCSATLAEYAGVIAARVWVAMACLVLARDWTSAESVVAITLPAPAVMVLLDIHQSKSMFVEIAEVLSSVLATPWSCQNIIVT